MGVDIAPQCIGDCLKRALISGITGQDGAYLAELLLAKGYEVHGIQRRASSFNTDRIDHLREATGKSERRFFLHYGDLTDAQSLLRIIHQVQPDEIYNLGAQSHVQLSFETPEYTANVDALGTLRLLESMRILGLTGKTRFYQASTSELFGKVVESPQTELTPFHPRSPYGVAKLYAYWIAVNYREAYDVYACNGILFNHESPRRGETFVTRKITRALARMHLGADECLRLGNLDARRDWGHARDYVQAQWLMLQQTRAEDFVIATGVEHSVRDFVVCAAAVIGITLEWQGRGIDECAIVRSCSGDSALRVGQRIVTIDPEHFRPAEVDSVLGNPAKAFEKLGWRATTSFQQLVEEMMQSDLAIARRDVSHDRAGSAPHGNRE